MTATLNRAQASAVRTLQGPLLVLAGAGTGKTRVITFRIAELIRHGVAPERILALTFTNKAAREMQARAKALLGRRERGAKTPEISTFHSLCVRILRRHITHLGYPKEFVIYDRGDQETLARSALRHIRVDSQKLKPSELIGMISGWKSAGLPPEAALAAADSEKYELGAMGYARYQEGLKASGAVDFDDLLSLTERLFDQFEEVRLAEACRHDHVLIDEYQDTNALQYRIVRNLARQHQNLCVVGDDDQSIYGWRGAEVTHILSFAHDWPGAAVVRLEQNYRSTAAIIELANTLIAHNRTRHEKKLIPEREIGPAPKVIRYDDEAEEATEVVRDIKDKLTPRTDHKALAPADIAILFRTNEQPRAFEIELRREKIPYILVGGLSFYDRKEVRDVLAYLRLLANPSDELSLLRVINTPPRGIGPKVAQTLLQQAVASGLPLWHVLDSCLDHPEIGAVVAQRVLRFRSLIITFRERLGKEPLSETARALLNEVNYRAEIEQAYKTGPEIEARMASVEELVNSLAQYEARSSEASLLGFLEETALAERDDLKDDDGKKPQNAVTLMTLHSAKGLEFPHVYLVGLEEGILPHRRSIEDATRNIEEERRLCYVGVTRARDQLNLSFCKHRMKWGKLRPSIPSRFLMEMRGETERAARAAEAALELFTKEKAEASAFEKKAAKEKKPTKKKAVTRSKRTKAQQPSRAVGLEGKGPPPS